MRYLLLLLPLTVLADLTVDTDNDGVLDINDPCIASTMGGADLNGDCVVNFADFGILRQKFL